MILYGSKGWKWQLKSLPKRIQKYDVPVRFSIVEREIVDMFGARTMMMNDESVVAFGIEDADTLLGILFDESLKSRCIAKIDENWYPISGIDITIILVQGENYTNIDANVLDSFAKVFKK